MEKRVLFSILFASFFVLAKSQTVMWQMEPRNYQDVIRIAQNLYIVTQNGKIGLINSDGTIIAPIENDDISKFYEHISLLTAKDAQGERVTGYLTDDFSYVPFSKKYYTLAGQKFYSDGLLSVADASGATGYIDKAGYPVIGFDGSFKRIKPFTEGYAAVIKQKKYVLIDKEGREMKFTYGGTGVGAAIGGCTNVYNGTAYVFDEYGGSDRSYFLWDSHAKGPLKKVGKVKNTEMDYLFCYQSVSGRTKEIPYKSISRYHGDRGLEPVTRDGMYVFNVNGKPLVFTKFNEASPFDDNLAIVDINGQKGILRYIGSQSFSHVVLSEPQTFYEGNSVQCKFRLSVPGVWTDRCSAELTDQAGNLMTVNMSGEEDTFVFSFKPTRSGAMDFNLKVWGDDLELYQGKLTFSFILKERCPVCGKDLDVCHGNHHEVKPEKEEKCPTCGKKISECPYQGVH